MKVYLAGPICGLDFETGSDWREKAKAELAKANVHAYSPLRGFEHLANTGILDSSRPDSNVISCSRGVMTRDRNDATTCDVLLVNLLGAEKVSIGTVMEVAWADLKRIPIVVVMEAAGNPHEHMMLSEAHGYRVTSIEEAVGIVKLILDVKVAA